MFPASLDSSKRIPVTKLNKLSLLKAAEMECLRLYPPIGSAMPRDTPPGGTVICRLYIPAGVAVGVPAATIGRHAMAYCEPQKWNPERWRDETADMALMKTCFLGLVFGSRQCIGRNVATQFITKLIATLLLRHEVELKNPELVLGTKEFTILKPSEKDNAILRRRII